jgi:hypothetical protein
MTRFLFVVVSLLLISGWGAASAAAESFRPEAGKFPPLEKAHSYRGELIFVDHANRRGSLRVEGTGKFYRNDPHPFAMLPYGIVRYHGAPADLRDIPLGTVMHVRAFLPPDPKTSAVPVLPVDSKSFSAPRDDTARASCGNGAKANSYHLRRTRAKGFPSTRSCMLTLSLYQTSNRPTSHDTPAH